jgi:hypothetical protein
MIEPHTTSASLSAGDSSDVCPQGCNEDQTGDSHERPSGTVLLMGDISYEMTIFSAQLL